MQKTQETEVDDLIRRLIADGADETAAAVADLFDLAWRLEHQQNIVARKKRDAIDIEEHRQNDPVDKAKAIARLRNLSAAQTGGAPKFADSPILNHGSRSARAMRLVLAEMHVRGVSTLETDDLIARSGIESVSDAQVNQAGAVLDEELGSWSNRPLGEVRYIVLAERRERVREDGVVCEASVLSAVGVGLDERRRIIGVLCALSHDPSRWRTFLEELIRRGMHGVQFIVSDNFDGLRSAREALLPAVPWQHCQANLTQGAIDHARGMIERKRLNADLRQIWDASCFHDAREELRRLVESYRVTAPILSNWIQDNVPAGLTVFRLPEAHRRFMRSTQSVERAVQQELKRSTQQVRFFPSRASLERLARAVFVEIDEKWAWAEQPYLKWEDSKAVGGAYAYS